MKKYVCTQGTSGDPENGAEPGTAFKDLPEDWVCPECGAGIEDFEEA